MGLANKPAQDKQAKAGQVQASDAAAPAGNGLVQRLRSMNYADGAAAVQPKKDAASNPPVQAHPDHSAGESDDHEHGAEGDNKGAPAKTGLGAFLSSMVGHHKAKSRHKKNIKHMQGVLERGRAEENTKHGPLWPNSCEWLLSRHVNLHVLTQTHDALSRAQANDKSEQRAYFGIDTGYPEPSTYNRKDTSNVENIVFLGDATKAFKQSSGDKIVVPEPMAENPDLLREVLVHETQHDADHHDDAMAQAHREESEGENAAGKVGDIAIDIERYSTEFRAFWLSGEGKDQGTKSFADGGKAAETVALDSQGKNGISIDGFDNARQWAIFRYLYRQSSYSKWIRKAWTGPNADRFQSHVKSMSHLQTLNAINSVRIEEMYEFANWTGARPADVLHRYNKLSDEEKDALAGDEMRTSWIDLLERSHFEEPEQEQLKREMGLSS